jgi:hypothetical protein
VIGSQHGRCGPGRNAWRIIAQLARCAFLAVAAAGGDKGEFR